MILDSDGDPFEYAVEIPGLTFEPSEPRIHIGITKIGGGTLGVAYVGTWEWAVSSDGEILFSGRDLSTPIARTHHECAQIVAYVIADTDGEPLTGIQRAFIADAEYRLNSFAEGI